jgi:hypothetical protein
MVKRWPEFLNGKKQNGGQNHLKTGFKNCLKNYHLNTGQSGGSL